MRAVSIKEERRITPRTPVLHIALPLCLRLLEPLIRELLELLQQFLLPGAKQLVVLRVHEPPDEFLATRT
jgi:hypothetical protein